MDLDQAKLEAWAKAHFQDASAILLLQLELIQKTKAFVGSADKALGTDCEQWTTAQRKAWLDYLLDRALKVERAA